MAGIHKCSLALRQTFSVYDTGFEWQSCCKQKKVSAHCRAWLADDDVKRRLSASRVMKCEAKDMQGRPPRE